MSKAFNLLDEPWLPVRLTDGSIIELGLLDVFNRSAEIVALAETAPPNLIAQYRLLLVITHRALGDWKKKDRAVWYQNGLPLAAIHEYLERWRERFWLFHPEFPFMQVAALATADETRDKRKPWTQITLASANGNAPVVFDHACDAAPVNIRPADAIGTLLGFLQFTPGGLVKTFRDADKAGALANTAAVLPVGATLAQTLCLCLHPPATGKVDDLPAWERSPLPPADLRGEPQLATGPNDRYTRQSRAVLLLREEDGNILWLRFAAGLALGDDPNAPDPMASYRVGANGLVRLTFSEGRAVWRDLPALAPDAPDVSGKAVAQPAAVLGYAINLHNSLDVRVHQPLLIAGLASDQAKLLRWRSEQIALPAVLLADVEAARHLRMLVQEAEALFSDLRNLGTRMLAETLPDPASKETRTRARNVLDSGPLAASYFGGAERALAGVLELLGEDEWEQAETRWHAALRESAEKAWTQLLIGMGSSPPALRADAKFWSRFHGLLKKHVPQPEPDLAKEA